MSAWTLQSDFVRAEIQSLGAMLGPAWFELDDAEVQPFAIGPWADDPHSSLEALPPILRRLRGEWVCVPFGIEQEGRALPVEWQPVMGAVFQPGDPHGMSSNAEWHVVEHESDRITVSLDYPESHPVKSLRRTISGSRERPQLDMRLEVEVREPCSLPIGLHPTLRLPTEPRRARLEFEAGALAWTSPIPLEPHLAQFRSDQRQVPLHRIPLREGQATEDVTRLPLPYPAEETLLVTGHSGRAVLRNLEERYEVSILWEPKVFPACQLWLSNRGREYYPWNKRFLALGIEPVCAAFDLGTRESANRSNPLWRAGIPSAVSLVPDRVFSTSYSIAVARADSVD